MDFFKDFYSNEPTHILGYEDLEKKQKEEKKSWLQRQAANIPDKFGGVKALAEGAAAVASHPVNIAKETVGDIWKPVHKKLQASVPTPSAKKSFEDQVTPNIFDLYEDM